MNLARRAQPWLGTLVEIAIGPDASAMQAAAFEAAFAAIANVHYAMSPQHPESDLAVFNAADLGALTPCGADTRKVLEAARTLGEASLGHFDITIGTGGLAAWRLEPLGLRKLKNGTRLDAGGIGKGYAVDQAVSALREAGISSGWVNAGGDLSVFGELELPVHIRSLDQPARTLPLTGLRHGALATSVLPMADGSLAHISVAAPECLWADALTKIVAYARPERSAALLARYHAQAWRHATF